MTPERMCVGCRQRAPQHALLRVVVDAAGVAVVDDRRQLPGRGAYLHPDPACIRRALTKKALPRALRSPACDTTALSALGTVCAKKSDTD